MPKPTPLPPGASPAAEAVWAAWSNAEIFFDIELTDRCALAAALRAAAGQVVPEYKVTPGGSKIWQSEPELSIRADLLAIADELEGAR